MEHSVKVAKYQLYHRHYRPLTVMFSNFPSAELDFRTDCR